MADADDTEHQELFTVTQVARLLLVTPRTVTNWCETGRIKSFKTPGGHRRVPREEVMKYIRATNGIRVLGDNGQ